MRSIFRFLRATLVVLVMAPAAVFAQAEITGVDPADADPVGALLQAERDVQLLTRLPVRQGFVVTTMHCFRVTDHGFV